MPSLTRIGDDEVETHTRHALLALALSYRLHVTRRFPLFN